MPREVDQLSGSLDHQAQVDPSGGPTHAVLLSTAWTQVVPHRQAHHQPQRTYDQKSVQLPQEQMGEEPPRIGEEV